MAGTAKPKKTTNLKQGAVIKLKNDDCESLARRTWDLHRLLEPWPILRGCVAEGSLREKEKMMSIRDSLKDVHNILIFLQGLKSSQNKQRDDALSHLEESIKIVIQRINEYPKKGRKMWSKIDEKAKHKNVLGIESQRSNFVVGVARFGVESSSRGRRKNCDRMPRKWVVDTLMRVWRPAALREASTRLMARTTTEETLPGHSVASGRPWVMRNGVFEPGVDVQLELGENEEVGVGNADGELDACVGSMPVLEKALRTWMLESHKNSNRLEKDVAAPFLLSNIHLD
ncbi:leucine--tRNA ligase, partial [Striga asiatica]